MNPIQWTVEQVRARFDQLAREADRQRAAISTNNGRVMALDARASKIADPVKRARLKAAVAEWVQRQARIVAEFKQATQRVTELRRQVAAFLSSVGIQHGLSGPALLILAPAALVTVIVVVERSLQAIKLRNETQRVGLQQTDRVLAMVERGQLAASEAAALIEKKRQDADAPAGDPLGIGAAAKGIIGPALVIAGAFLFGPALFKRAKAMGARTAERW